MARSSRAQAGVNLHVDGAAAQLSAGLYLSDVRPGGGGTNVAHGSHSEMYGLMGARPNTVPM